MDEDSTSKIYIKKKLLLPQPGVIYFIFLFYFSNFFESVPRRLSEKYSFEKPNDRRALNLMNTAASAVMNEFPDVMIAYGVSDEYR
jgi:tRNAHis guanylyltransferase